MKSRCRHTPDTPPSLNEAHRFHLPVNPFGRQHLGLLMFGGVCIWDDLKPPLLSQRLTQRDSNLIYPSQEAIMRTSSSVFTVLLLLLIGTVLLSEKTFYLRTTGIVASGFCYEDISFQPSDRIEVPRVELDRWQLLQRNSTNVKVVPPSKPSIAMNWLMTIFRRRIGTSIGLCFLYLFLWLPRRSLLESVCQDL